MILARRHPALQNPAPRPGLWLVPRGKPANAPRRISRLVYVLFSGAVYLVLFAAIVLLLAATLPGLLGYHSTIIYGGSMGDALPAGSVALTRTVDASAVVPGDIIAFRGRADGLGILHRVVSVEVADGRRVATTRGDANASNDPQPLSLEGGGDRVLFHVRWVGYLLAFVRSPRALAFVVGPAVTVWLIVLAGSRWRARQRAAEAVL